MRTKICKKLLVIICILVLLLSISLTAIAQITDISAGSKQIFGISLMHQSNKLNGQVGIGFGYRIDGKNAYRIYSGNDDANGYIDTVLCLDKDGKFPKEPDSANRGEYTSLGTATYETLNQAKSSINQVDSQKIQWLIRNALLPEDSYDLRNQKLSKIFGDILASTETTENPLTVDYIKSILTEDDIVFALQCAIWKITNNTTLGSLQGTSDNGDTWDGLEGNDKWGYKGRKGVFIRKIINYYNTILSGNITEEDTSTKTNPAFDTTLTATQNIEGAYVFLGPFKINSGTNYYSIDIGFENKTGQELSNVSYLLTDKPSNQSVTVLPQTKEGLEGKEFYVRIPSITSARKVKFRLVTQIQVGIAEGTVWVDGVATDQPLLSIKRTELPGEIIEAEYPFDIVIEKQYDASLRKYISAIKRKTTTGKWQTVELLNEENRSPGNRLISATEEEPFNQYVYNHRKDPVESVTQKDGNLYDLQVGDRVVYTIRVTNECDRTMIIKSITDYLPPVGIEYVSDDSLYSSEDNKWEYNSNQRYAITKKISGWTLDPGMYAEVQIVCVITEEARGRVITNIAEITEIADEQGKVVTDIDSQPKNVKLPTTEQEWENYKGNEGFTPDGLPESRYENKDDLSDSNYYYKGQQDDDDFEKIRIKINDSEYDLEIVKVDKDDNTKKLANAEFEVTYQDGSKQTVITEANGIGVGKKIKISGTGTDRIKIVEKRAPEGYKLLPYGFEMMVVKDVKNGSYSIEASITTDLTGISMSKDGNRIIITIEDEKIPEESEYDVEIVKIDGELTDKRLAGAKFELTMPDGSNKEVESGVDGTIRTDKIEVKDTETDVIKIKETEAPEGYNKIIDEIELEITKELRDGKYIATAKLKNAPESVTLSSEDKTIIITIPNKQIIGDYDIKIVKVDDEDYNVKLSGAKFELMFPNGTKSNLITGENGIAKSDIIYIRETGKDIIKLKEVEAPDGYESIIDELELEVTKELQDGKYFATAKLKNAPDGVTLSSEGKTLIITVPNKKIKKFDLALRKFITKINEKDVTDRIPKVSYEDEKLKYSHTKEPKIVVGGQIVTYTIRVYNEGEEDGYATEITDDLPEGLIFLPDHKTNEKYEWKMYDKDDRETSDVKKAVKIKTRYLSRDMSTDNLLTAFDGSKPISNTNPSYKDVEVAFEVTQESATAGKKVIINTAEISEDEDKDGKAVDDIDSTPDNENPDEDDIDKEYLVLKYFDLSLLKYVSRVIVTEDGVTKEINTGYTGMENPEPVVKVELNKKKLNKTDIKYVYSIKITNEGEIEGYATEITDRIPSGLAFYEDDNTEYNWKTKEKGIVTTDYLKNTLLKPGESALVQIVLRWERSEQNLGQKVNVAEISEDDNEYDVPDIDSTPNNNKDGEDDQDSAIVVLSIQTGKTTTYILFITMIILILASGLYLIYKNVIRE